MAKISLEIKEEIKVPIILKTERENMKYKVTIDLIKEKSDDSSYGTTETIFKVVFLPKAEEETSTISDMITEITKIITKSK